MTRRRIAGRGQREETGEEARARFIEVGGKPGQGSAAAGRSKRLAPGLYIVSTPIGNARDITLRALDVLGQADLVACEDTRVTTKLLAIHGLGAPLTAYHDHNARKVRPGLLKRLADGAAIALVSDAGTPLVSDPGFKLVAEAAAAGIAVLAVPGAAAPIAALTVAGLPTDRALFAGFLPPRRPARLTALAELAAAPATLVFFEVPRRLAAALDDMTQALGDRPAAVARELTKLFEETRRGTLAGLAAHYHAEGPPKGEVVVVIGPPEKRAVTPEAIDALLTDALASGSVRDAALRWRRRPARRAARFTPAPSNSRATGESGAAPPRLPLRPSRRGALRLVAAAARLPGAGAAFRRARRRARHHRPARRRVGVHRGQGAARRR